MTVEDQRDEERIAPLTSVLTCLHDSCQESACLLRIEDESIGGSVREGLFPSGAELSACKVETMVEPLIECQRFRACGIESYEVRLRRKLSKAECRGAGHATPVASVQ